jgi:hypothetical protein
MTTLATADWCEATEGFAICGTRMREDSRRLYGRRWCFHCRVRHDFDWVVMVPDGLSYYGPHAEIQGPTSQCTDLFPGWSREWVED